MPSRVLREGIISSDRVNELTPESEVFYRRLMSKVDDHGRFDARSSVLRASLYPLKLDTVSENNCEQWLTDCINARLLIVYQIDGKPYVQMLDTKWQTRSASKYPAPNSKCKQLKAPVHLDVVVVVVRCRLIEVVDVVVGAPVDNSVEPEPEVVQEAKVNGVDKDPKVNSKSLGDRAAALGLQQYPGEAKNLFMLRVASEEAKRGAAT